VLKLKVRCPHCGAERTTQSVKRVMCFNCGRTFSVYQKIRGSGALKTNIVKILQGTRQDLFKKFYESYKTGGKK